MAMMSGGGTPAFAALAWVASRAAFIMATPPLAWRSIAQAPSFAASAAAPATVFGMSWYLRSRKTRCPASLSRRTMSGPAAVNNWLPTLTAPTAPRRPSASASALAGLSTSSATMTGFTAPMPAHPNQRPLASAAELHRAHQVGCAGHPVAGHVVLDARQQRRPDERIDEIRRAHLHGRRAR